FFFQAEDGIRDFHVTGVQTCALPISIALLAIMAGTANAQTVQRCVGPDGKVTFTQTGCGTELRPEQVYDASSPPPSGGRDVVPLASPERFPRPHPAPRGNPRDRVTVVGE